MKELGMVIVLGLLVVIFCINFIGIMRGAAQEPPQNCSNSRLVDNNFITWFWYKLTCIRRV